jgi:hypothetical protein
MMHAFCRNRPPLSNMDNILCVAKNMRKLGMPQLQRRISHQKVGERCETRFLIYNSPNFFRRPCRQYQLNPVIKMFANTRLNRSKKPDYSVFAGKKSVKTSFKAPSVSTQPLTRKETMTARNLLSILRSNYRVNRKNILSVRDRYYVVRTKKQIREIISSST